MSPEAAREFYSREYFTGGKDRNGYPDYIADRECLRVSFRQKLCEIERYRQPGVILDVGCAAGFFLEEAKERGWVVYGHEVSQYAADVARRSLGDCIFVGQIDSIDLPPRSVDVITMWDVIEHLEEPLRVLCSLRELLKDDGMFVLCTGDIDSWLARLHGERSRIYNPPQHLCYYSAATLTSLLQKAGLRVIGRQKDWKTMSLRYILFVLAHVNNNRLARTLDRHVGQRWVGRLRFNVPLFDNMRVYAVKDNALASSFQSLR